MKIIHTYTDTHPIPSFLRCTCVTNINTLPFYALKKIKAELLGCSPCAKEFRYLKYSHGNLLFPSRKYDPQPGQKGPTGKGSGLGRARHSERSAGFSKVFGLPLIHKPHILAADLILIKVS